MEFVAALLQRLCDDQTLTLAAAASDAYSNTLYVYHGWITSAAFTVALKVSYTLGSKDRLQLLTVLYHAIAVSSPHASASRGSPQLWAHLRASSALTQLRWCTE